MTRIAEFGLCVAILLVLSGCVTRRFQTNTAARNMPISSVPKLDITQPVALRNSSSNSGDIIIGKAIGWIVYGDLYKFTESSIGAAKGILEGQKVKIADDADKILELSVYDAKSEQGAIMFRVTTALRVRTGDGLEKECVRAQSHGNMYGTTPAIEKTLAHCVEEMLNDKEIVDYLEN